MLTKLNIILKIKKLLIFFFINQIYKLIFKLTFN